MLFFFFNDTATTEIYTLSLHDALPISRRRGTQKTVLERRAPPTFDVLIEIQTRDRQRLATQRSEEHTSELQSRQYLVCRLLLEKKTHSRPPITPRHRCQPFTRIHHIT